MLEAFASSPQGRAWFLCGVEIVVPLFHYEEGLMLTQEQMSRTWL